MAKILQIMTVLTIACNILQVSSTNSTTTTTGTRQTITETHFPSITASRSTDSTSATMSARTPTSIETHPTNRTPTETSLHPTSTSSQSHTSSYGKITSTDQTKTDLVSSHSSGTTTLRSTELVSVIPSLSSTEEPGKTATSPEKVNSTQSSASSNKGDSLATNPGLVAILCIFFIILALLCVVIIAKLISSQRSSQFERLDEVPMNKMSEDAPFARYPPK